MGCLYKLTSPSGKSYVGITSLTLKARWNQHRFNANKGRGDDCAALYNAIRKYGADAFAVESLSASDDWSKLCRLERDAIAIHGTLAPRGYNLTHGGEGALGWKPSAVIRQRMSDSQRRAQRDPSIAAARDERLAFAVETRRRNWWARSAEERKAWGIVHGAKVKAGHATEESKAKTKLAAKNRWTPDVKAKFIQARTGLKIKPWTDERKQRAADQRRREWADPEMRAKRLDGFAAARSGV